MITHIPVQVDDERFVLTTEGPHAQAVNRIRSIDDLELLWVPPAEPTTDARAVLETAGYSTTAPYGRVA